MRSLFILLIFLLFLQSWAAPPQPFLWRLDWEDHQNPVEQQTQGGATASCEAAGLPCVYNPTLSDPEQREPWFWDADDRADWFGSGLIEPGEIIEQRVSVFADWAAHLSGFVLRVNENRVRLEMRIAVRRNGGDLFAPISKTVSAQGWYKMCVLGPDYDSDPANPALETIPNSGINGAADGRAAPIEIIFRLRNAGSGIARRSTAKISVNLGAENYQNEFCPSGFPITVRGSKIGTFNPMAWFDYSP